MASADAAKTALKRAIFAPNAVQKTSPKPSESNQSQSTKKPVTNASAIMPATAEAKTTAKILSAKTHPMRPRPTADLQARALIRPKPSEPMALNSIWSRLTCYNNLHIPHVSKSSRPDSRQLCQSA